VRNVPVSTAPVSKAPVSKGPVSKGPVSKVPFLGRRALIVSSCQGNRTRAADAEVSADADARAADDIDDVPKIMMGHKSSTRLFSTLFMHHFCVSMQNV
jgi:hypothetical protein|tara:strand:- start:1244 stop:1540 length:297 start_codon:yes stop_codon:yes gene_type:complete